MPMLLTKRVKSLRQRFRDDRRAFMSFALIVLTMFIFLSTAIEGLVTTTTELATYQRMTTEQLALTMTHASANFVANYDTTAANTSSTIPATVQDQINSAMNTELAAVGGTGSTSCAMVTVNDVRCSVRYRAPSDYLAFGGAFSNWIGYTTVTRTEALVGIAAG